MPRDNGGLHIQGTITWRVRAVGRAGAVFALAAWVGLAAGITAGGGVSPGVILLLWAVAVLTAPAVWALAFRPYIALTSNAVVAQDPLVQRSLRYDELLSVTPGYYGLTIRTKDGRCVMAWAVQKSSAAKWGQKRTRADEVADKIRVRASVPAPLSSP